MSNLPPPSQTDLLNLALASSPELRSRVETIFNMLLDDMEQVIRIGYRPHVLALQKAVIPHLLRAFQSDQSDTMWQAQREAFERMMDVQRRGTVVDTTGTTAGSTAGSTAAN